MQPIMKVFGRMSTRKTKCDKQTELGKYHARFCGHQSDLFPALHAMNRNPMLPYAAHPELSPTPALLCLSLLTKIVTIAAAIN